MSESEQPINIYAPSVYYQHIDGGIYRTMQLGKSAENGEVVVIYEHVFPFEGNVWVRAYSEWTSDRFKRIEHNDVSMIMQRERLVFQAEITARRQARKAAKA